ncbi:MAG: polysaccharide deacetylase family protein [Egibacteraceae bacterium]
MSAAGGGQLAQQGATALAKRLVLRALPPGLAGRGADHHVALTFDDGPDPASTPQFLALLDSLGWRATFFMLGSMVDRNPGLAAEVAAAGHDIGSHSYEHLHQTRRSPRAVRDDVTRSLEVIAEATGRAPRWFRPPGGGLSVGGLATTWRHHVRTVLWTASGQDWQPWATPDSVAAHIERNLRGGATVLLHDSDCASVPGAWRATLGALPLLAEMIADRGLRVGPLTEHWRTSAAGE